MTDGIKKPGLGTERDAERVINAYAEDLVGLTMRGCLDAFDEEIARHQCVMIQDTLRDGFVDSYERMRLLNAGFSGSFVYRLADGDSLIKRANWLAGNIDWWSRWRYSVEEQISMVYEIGDLKWPDIAASHILPQLSEVLMDSDSPSKLRVAIVENLGKMGREAIPLLTKALDINDALVRKTAVHALRRLGKVAIPSLKHASLTNEDPVVCRAATKAITKIKNGL